MAKGENYHNWHLLLFSHVFNPIKDKFHFQSYISRLLLVNAFKFDKSTSLLFADRGRTWAQNLMMRLFFEKKTKKKQYYVLEYYVY